MKTKDFETAIAALNVGIVIDEMKLRHSDVRQVYSTQRGWYMGKRKRVSS